MFGFIIFINIIHRTQVSFVFNSLVIIEESLKNYWVFNLP